MSAPIVVIDTEWGYRYGRRDCETAFEPVVFCARILGGDSFSFRGRDDRLSAFAAAHRDHVWVAHSATAEMKYLLRLGIAMPPHWWDTMVAFRAVHNRPGHLAASLVAALSATGLAHLIPPDKNEIREKIVRLAFNDADMPAITNYCFEDVTATAALFEKLVNRVDPVAMTYWCEYLKAVARMELLGIPIDTKALKTILDHRHHVHDALMARINLTTPIYRHDGSFSGKAFFRFVTRQGINWPRKRSKTTGRLYRPLDDDTLEMMEGRHEFIGEVRQTRKTLRSLGKFGIKVDGRSRRHFFSTMPFRSVTGRNQPSKFIFGGPKWMRWLVVPPSSDHVLIYADFAAQEIGIAAALSRDEAMREMYVAVDPHMAFAIMAGAAPPEATKTTHSLIRKQFKTVNLAVLYSQTEFGVADRLGIEIAAAADLLRQHRRLFHAYHAWSEKIVSAAFDRRFATTRLGWRANVRPDSKWRTWANFPIQATGADIMRVMTIALDRQGVEILAIVHDGWLLSCRRDDQDRLRDAVENARRFACDKVLDDFPLKIDTTIYTGRFEDEEGAPAWYFIESVLPEEVLRVPPE